METTQCVYSAAAIRIKISPQPALNQLVLICILRTFGEAEAVNPAHLVSIKYKLRCCVEKSSRKEGARRLRSSRSSSSIKWGFSAPCYHVHTHTQTTSEQSQTLSWFIVAGEISLERQNLAVYAEDDENVLFSSVLLPGDLRSNYFCYQSRSVRWLYKKLQWQNGKEIS